MAQMLQLLCSLLQSHSVQKSSSSPAFTSYQFYCSIISTLQKWEQSTEPSNQSRVTLFKKKLKKNKKITYTKHTQRNVTTGINATFLIKVKVKRQHTNGKNNLCNDKYLKVPLPLHNVQYLTRLFYILAPAFFSRTSKRPKIGQVCIALNNKSTHADCSQPKINAYKFHLNFCLVLKKIESVLYSSFHMNIYVVSISFFEMFFQGQL